MAHTPLEWNQKLLSLPQPHLLQSWEWGQVKAQYGWLPLPQTWGAPGTPDAAALILQRTIAVGGFAARLRMLYVPKGPIMDWANLELRHQVLEDLAALARRQGAIFIKIDPDIVIGLGIPGEPGSSESELGQQVLNDLREGGWRFSGEQVQFRNTVLVDLSVPEEELLARMKQKTRYNVRLAQKKGVQVRVGGPPDFPMLYRMYAETALRDGFAIREERYYCTVWQTFTDAGLAEPLIAEVEGEPAAAVFIFRFGGRAWYIYGMSRPLHREKMPNYLLQWEAMRRAKSAGCNTYDLWGAPDQFDESDSMWGVYRFKEGLGGQVVRTIGAWDLPTRPLLYRLYTQTLPRLLNLMRRRGLERTQRTVIS
jgi:peptidoglycan pentaglycine glycine transferase (the first glycine)